MKKQKIKSIKGFMPVMLVVMFVVMTGGIFIGEVFVIPILSAIDLALTYTFMRIYRKHQPKDKEWNRFEQNGLAKFMWGKLGLEFGTLAMLVIALAFWYFFIYALFKLSASLFVPGVFTGLYIFILSSHIMNLKMLRDSIKEKNGR